MMLLRFSEAVKKGFAHRELVQANFLPAAPQRPACGLRRRRQIKNPALASVMMAMPAGRETRHPQPNVIQKRATARAGMAMTRKARFMDFRRLRLLL